MKTKIKPFTMAAAMAFAGAMGIGSATAQQPGAKSDQAPTPSHAQVQPVNAGVDSQAFDGSGIASGNGNGAPVVMPMPGSGRQGGEWGGGSEGPMRDWHHGPCGMAGPGHEGPHGPHGPGPQDKVAFMKIIFALLDTNGDGALELNEVQNAHARIFHMIDANGDGKVTPQEIMQFFGHP